MIDVLVVDDDFHVAGINERYVSRVPGFRVVGRAHDAASAFAAVQRGGIDLVLLDHYLPDESGLCLTRRLRREGPDVDVIMVTADNRPASVQEALRAGVLQYIVKPFTFEALRGKLEGYAQLRAALGDTALDQDKIDRVLGTLRAAAAVGHMPKGYTERTAELIRQIVCRAGGPVSAHEVSAQARVSRSTAQRYLKYLEEQGRLRLTLKYGDSGRPEHHYSTA
ncbi:response regulator [Streptomyces caeni]|uniref:Transcriptional regulatory protein n=1 Tax=Streptomyces caeni TaxID=2307231 RepID=A0ABW4IWT1_9ACTN